MGARRRPQGGTHWIKRLDSDSERASNRCGNFSVENRTTGIWSPRASTGTVTPRFQAASTSVGVAGYRRTSCYFRCYFRPRTMPGYEKTAISRGFLKWCRRRDSNPHPISNGRKQRFYWLFDFCGHRRIWLNVVTLVVTF